MDHDEKFLKTIIEPKSKTAGLSDEDRWKEEEHSDFEKAIIEEKQKKG